MITLRHCKPGLALGLVLAGALAIPAGASANTVECSGTTAPTAPKSTDLVYAFACSEEIKSYSFVSNISVQEFSTTADVLDPATGTPGDGQSMSCEGSFPGDGFACSGDAKTPNRVVGQFSIDGGRCVKGKNQLRTWVVAVDMNNTASPPFWLHGEKCPKPAKPAKKKHSRKHARRARHASRA